MPRAQPNIKNNQFTMPKESVKDLMKFLKPFPPNIKEIALWLRDFVWDLYPESNELIYDNYNALAFGWSTTDKAGDVFCSVAVYGGGVNFGFNRGSEISDPKGILLGEGSHYRRIRVAHIKEFPKAYIKKLLKEAYANSLTWLKEKKRPVKGATITKSVAPIKRRPK
jgi:hypothetical protein